MLSIERSLQNSLAVLAAAGLIGLTFWLELRDIFVVLRPPGGSTGCGGARKPGHISKHLPLREKKTIGHDIENTHPKKACNLSHYVPFSQQYTSSACYVVTEHPHCWQCNNAVLLLNEAMQQCLSFHCWNRHVLCLTWKNLYGTRGVLF